MRNPTHKIRVHALGLMLVAGLFSGTLPAQPHAESESHHHGHGHHNHDHHHGQQGTLNPFTAQYSLVKKGLTIGEIRLSLKQEDDRWRFETHAKAAGFAAMFSDDTVTESTLLKIDQQNIQPLHYRYLRSGDKHGKDLEIEFNWEKATAKVKEQNESTSVELKDNTLNEHSITLALILALKSGFSEKTYTVLDETKLETQTYTRADEETVKVPAGEFNAVKVVRNHGSRKTIGWYAPMLHYLPIKIQSLKDGKLKSEMELLPVE